MLNKIHWLPAFSLIVSLLWQGATGLKDVQVEAPRYTRRHEDLALRCNYDMEVDSLYAIKWYRGSEEFYRFLPKESPPKQAFPIPGIHVDVNKSDDRNVFLRNISFETNGRFKCVISAEGTFQTLESAKDIDVVEIDYNSPKLFLDKMNYQKGDRGLANCSIENTYPPPNITWFINGKQVDNISVVTKILEVVDVDGRIIPRKAATTAPTTTTEISWRGKNGTSNATRTGKLTSTVSTLLFPVQSYSPLVIKCMGQLYDVYNETSSIQIKSRPPPNYVTPNPTLSNQQKFGMPNQLHSFNDSLANCQDQLSPSLLVFITTAQLFHVYLQPLALIFTR